MRSRVIPLIDARAPSPARITAPSVLPEGAVSSGPLVDTRLRPLHDLRISVTDRCNFRCTYCMPASVFDKDYAFLPQAALLSFEEIERLARIFIAQGVQKIRITGGEPLLRKNLERLIERLARLQTPDGKALDLTLTTNASLLKRKAASLRDAGLQRVTVSLDALDEAIFRRMNDVDFPVADVLEGIEAANAVGLGPLKINMVVKRGVNDAQILPMARHFKGTGSIVRFIEFMDVGSSNGWRMDDVVPSREVISTIHAQFPLASLQPNYAGEVAERWAYADGSGEIGVISSVTQAFCSTCSRARLSTEGHLFTCLFASQGVDLKSPLRAGASDAELAGAVAHVWRQRTDRYSEIRSSQTVLRPKVEMSYIGG